MTERANLNELIIEPHSTTDILKYNTITTYIAMEGSAIIHIEGVSMPIMNSIPQSVIAGDKFVLENARDEECVLLEIIKCI